MNDVTFWVWFTSAILAGLFGDVAMKRAGQGTVDWRWFAAGFTAYSATSIAWFVLLRVRKLSTFGTLYPVANALGLVLLGAFLFNEHLSVREWVGLGMALVAMGLLSSS